MSKPYAETCWLISELWVDPLENRDSHGYSPIGITFDEKVMLTYRNAEPLKPEGYPLRNANFGKPVPVYTIKELPVLPLQAEGT